MVFMFFEPRGEPLVMGYKKGVRIVYQSYSNFRSWLTFYANKTTAPHRRAYTKSLSGVCIATDVGAIVILSSHRFRRPSLKLEDKISITPFRRTKSPPSTNVDSARLPLPPHLLNQLQI